MCCLKILKCELFAEATVCACYYNDKCVCCYIPCGKIFCCKFCPCYTGEESPGISFTSIMDPHRHGAPDTGRVYGAPPIGLEMERC